MANTTYFGWETPDDTDLVKDGAAAIRTLGQAIDTSMQDLEGGTSGQILSKNSNTDMDFVWINNDQGDITEVQAGTGISVASGTGPIPVITNTVATEFDAKGDLVVGTGADTFDKLTVGANDTVLVADSSTATGLKWATPASGTPAFIGASARATGNQTIPNVTFTAINFTAADLFDTDAFHNPSSNSSRMTIPTGKGGKYAIWGRVGFNENNSTGRRIVEIYKNGSQVEYLNIDVPASAYQTILTSGIIELVATDYIQIFLYQGSGADRITEGIYSGFSIQYLGA